MPSTVVCRSNNKTIIFKLPFANATYCFAIPELYADDARYYNIICYRFVCFCDQSVITGSPSMSPTLIVCVASSISFIFLQTRTTRGYYIIVLLVSKFWKYLRSLRLQLRKKKNGKKKYACRPSFLRGWFKALNGVCVVVFSRFVHPLRQ